MVRADDPDPLTARTHNATQADMLHLGPCSFSVPSCAGQRRRLDIDFQRDEKATTGDDQCS